MKNRNKTKLILLSLIRSTFRVTESISPLIARKWAVNLFYSPVKFDYPAKEKKLLSTAEKFHVISHGKRLAGYEWGAGPTILFMHGWAGRATQVVEFVEPLVNAGFKVVALDAPAHGKSPGKKTHILEFKEAIFSIVTEKGPLYGAIGHSLGGTSLLFARKEGLQLEKLVVISVPSIADGIINGFLKTIGGSQKIGQNIKKHVQKKFNKSFEEFAALSLVSNPFPNTNLFLIHDKDDVEIPFIHFEELTERLPDSKKLITQFLGHTKILRNTEVVHSVIDFLNDGEVKRVENQENTTRDAV